MFNFQKEVVINSSEAYKAVDAATTGSAGSSGTGLDKKLRVHGGGEYFSKYIVDKKIYKTNPQEGALFTLTFDFASAGTLTAEGAHLQFLIELGLDRNYRGDYGSALWYFRKPILVDVMMTGEQNDDADALAKALKAAVPTLYKFITIEHSDSTSTVVIKGSDSYQKVRKVIVNKFECEDRCGQGSEELTEVYNLSGGKLAESSGFIAYSRNKVEFGTYEYLLHNLRLPTYANLRFTSPNAPEMPIQGKQYVQYSFMYIVPRVGLGGISATGQAINSVTTHTFFVLKDLETNFEGELTKIDGDLTAGNGIVTIDPSTHKVITVLPDVYAASNDLQNPGTSEVEPGEPDTESSTAKIE